MDVVNTLLSEFHKIQSTNVQESHKNFKIFLSTLQEKLKTIENENRFIANLAPQTKLEDLFKIDILLYLKRHEEVLVILQNDNKHHIGRILKNFNFFADIIPKLHVNVVIDDIFPKTSYITKLKVLNRISKTVRNEELLDEYFEKIEIKYGLKMAFALLPGCSNKLIKLKVEKYTPKLSCRQVIKIYKKDHSFPLFYFDLMKKIDTNFRVLNDYSPFIKLIVKKDPSLFWKLQKEFKFNYNIGKHLTKNLILSNEEVLKDGEKCLKWFENKELYKTVKELNGIDDFLLTFYKDNPIRFLDEQILKNSSSFFNILKFISPQKRYELIQNLFQKKYSQDILKYEKKFPKHFLEIIPVTIREPIVKKHYYNINDDYLYLLNANDAFYEIKKNLENCSKLEERTEKLELLSKIIEVNLNDETIVTKILKFVFERYRNDVKPLKAFVYKIADKNKNLKSFDENQLVLLNQMLPYTITEYSNRECFEKISIAYLEFLIENKKPYDDHLKDYLKRIATDDYYYNLNLPRDFKYINIIIEKIIEVLDSFKNNEGAYKKLTLGVVQNIFQYNKKHKKNLIPLSLYKHLLEYVFKRVYKHDTGLYLNYLIKKYNDNDIHRYFWEYYNTGNQWNSLIWFFKYDIKQIEDNLEKILSTSEETLLFNRPLKNIFIKAFDIYSTNLIKEKALDYIKNNLSYDNFAKTSFLLTILCCIDSKIFLEISKPFMPPLDGKFEKENGVNKKLTHEAVIRCLCKIELKDSLKVVKSICVGDYLKFGLKVLYKIVLNMKEMDVLSFLNDFKQSPVSVSKHTLFLALSLQLKEADTFLMKSLEIEKNSTIKNIIFKKYLDLFIDTKNDYFYKRLNGYFNIINPNDINLIRIIIKKIKNVPNDCKVDYVLNVFEVIKKTTKKEIPELFITLSNDLPKTVLNEVPLILLENITETIVQGIFLREFNNDCFWDFIINTNQERSKELFSFTIEIMKGNLFSITHNESVLKTNSNNYLKVRNSLNYFATTFCKKVLTAKDINHINLIKIMNLQWDFFPKHCLFNEYVFIKIIKMFYESEFDLEKFSSSFNHLLHQLIKEYDSGIIQDLAIQIKELFKTIDTDKRNDDLLNFTNFLLKSNDNNLNYNYVLAIYLLPNVFPTEDNDYYKWVGVIRLIEEFCMKGKNTDCVWFHYDKYLRGCKSEFIWVGNQKFPDVTTTKL